MIRRLNPLTSRLRGRLGLPNSYRDFCSRSWTLSPATQTKVPAAIFEPEDLVRVTGLFPNETRTSQFSRLEAGIRQHSATQAYELHDAVLSAGHLFTAKMALRLADRSMPYWASRCDRHFPDAALASSHYGLRYFGHWMFDDLPLALAAQTLAPAISLLTKPSAHQQGYLQLMELDLETLSDAVFDRIVVIDDTGQNDLKRTRYETLRSRARAALAPNPHRGVMLLRGTTGERRVLTNELSVAEALRPRGFAILDPMQLTARELAQACLDADFVVGVEGSQQAHGALLMSPRGCLIELQPPTRFNVLYKAMCDCIGMRYALVVGHPDGADFSIDISALHRLLDRLEGSENGHAL